MRPRSSSNSIHSVLDRLAAAERGFVGAEFLAPVLRGQGVQVRMAGVRCRLRVTPGDFEGWGVFRATSHADASLVRAATLAERRRYLALFPAVALVLVREARRVWLAAAAQAGDARFRIDGLVPVHLVEAPDRFDTATARFDGSRFWYDAPDDRADPGAAGYLRQMLSAGTDPARLDRPGLTGGQRTAYAAEHGLRAEAERRRQQAAVARAARAVERAERHRARTAEERVRASLAHAGASLTDLADRGDVYRVSYVVDGRPHTSVVRRTDLTVETAGICLSGQDRDFDLASLVGVIREGERRW